MNINVFYGILIPFLGTSVGAACVIFMKKNLNAHVQRALTGFASGVMVAASVWSLLLPSIEQSGKLGKFSLYRQWQAFGQECCFCFCWIM